MGSAPRVSSDPAPRGPLATRLNNSISAASNFEECLALRVGFEVDVRRSTDDHLVCVHDDSADRTTNGRSLVGSLTLDELRRFDAGSQFDPAFHDEHIPNLDEVLAIVKNHRRTPCLIAIDLKDADIEADTARIVNSRGVLDRVLFIGTAISNPDGRRQLRQADGSAHVTWPACTPSRSSTLTGRPPLRNGLYGMIRNDLVHYGHRSRRANYQPGSS